MHFRVRCVCASEALYLMYHNLCAAYEKIWCQIGVMRSNNVFKFKPHNFARIKFRKKIFLPEIIFHQSLSTNR